MVVEVHNLNTTVPLRRKLKANDREIDKMWVYSVMFILQSFCSVLVFPDW